MSKTVFLGVEGSGKTSLTVALAQAFENHKEEGWYLKPLSRDSFRFLKTLPDMLDGNFPSQTADLRELRWQAEYEGNDLGEIAILDYPGEIYRLAFLDANDERDPEAFRQKVAANRPEINALLHAIKEANDVFVLFNLSDGMDLRGNPRNLDAVWVTNECLKILKRLESKPRIRLLFTQADRYRSAGLDLSVVSPRSIELIGHDHPDMQWSLVSVIDQPESEYGIDSMVRLLIAEPLKRILESRQSVDLEHIDVEKLVYVKHDGACNEISIQKEYLASIDAAVFFASKATCGSNWMIATNKSCTWNAQCAADWETIKKGITEFDGKVIRDVASPQAFKGIKSDWGQALARRVAGRVEELKSKDANDRFREKIGLAILFGISILFIILVILASFH